MNLEIRRVERVPRASVGRLSVNGARECWTLEDVVRETPFHAPLALDAWVASWKIARETAIPSGRFAVTIDKSERFSLAYSTKWKLALEIWTPHILNVPGFSGIRMHSGSTDADTEGCPMLGQTHPAGRDFIGSSRLAVAAFMPKLEAALGLARVAPPSPEIAAALGPWAWRYVRERDPEQVWLDVVNDFPAETEAAPRPS